MSDTENKKNTMQQNGENEIPFPAPKSGEDDMAVQNRPSDEIYTGQQSPDAAGAAKKAVKKENIVLDVSILVGITLVAGGLLGLAYNVTKDPIAQAQAKARAEAQTAVMSKADHFEVLASEDEGDAQLLSAVNARLEESGLTSTTVDSIDTGLDAGGEPAGYVITATNSEGYGGDIGLMCGIIPQEDGSLQIEGISFLSLSETAGMGMRAKDAEFSDQFKGLTLQDGESVEYSKSGASASNEIDAISGCTITTAAVVKDVNAALQSAVTILSDGEGTADSAETEATK